MVCFPPGRNPAHTAPRYGASEEPMDIYDRYYAMGRKAGTEAKRNGNAPSALVATDRALGKSRDSAWRGYFDGYFAALALA